MEKLEHGKWYHFKIVGKNGKQIWYDFNDDTGEVTELFTR